MKCANSKAGQVLQVWLRLGHQKRDVFGFMPALFAKDQDRGKTMTEAQEEFIADNLDQILSTLDDETLEAELKRRSRK